MATTLATIKAEVQGYIGDASTATATRITRYANYVGREFWHRHPWHERKSVGTVDTVAPYEEGTAAFSGTAVTGSGTTWTAAMEGRKIARSLSAPYYKIVTRGGGTSLTIARSYLESDTSAAAYTIYGDVLLLAADCDVLLGDRLRMLTRDTDRVLERITPGGGSVDGAWPKTEGFPSVFWDVENSSAGRRQIQVWPVPDGTYAIEYPYLTKYTDLSSDSDNWVIPDRHASICITAICRHALRLHDDWEKAIAEDDRFFRAVDRAWLSDRRTMPRGSRMRGFDDPAGMPRRFGTFNYTG